MATKTARSWDAIVCDYERLADELTVLTVEARAAVDAGGETPPPVEPPPSGDVILVTENLPGAIAAAPAGAVLDLGGRAFTGAITIDKPLTVQNGEILAGANVNDLVALSGDGITLRDLVLRGDGT